MKVELYGRHENNLPKGCTDGELYGRHANSSPKDGELNSRHLPKEWTAQKKTRHRDGRTFGTKITHESDGEVNELNEMKITVDTEEQGHYTWHKKWIDDELQGHEITR